MNAMHPNASSAHTAYLGLGTNMGRREELLRQALIHINVRAGKVTACSDTIETESWGFSSSNRFLNMAVKIETPLSPRQLLNVTQDIERRLGRKNKSTGQHYADRPIDIDILLYDRLHVNEPDLTIPHPLMHLREFVMVPLRQIISAEELHAMQLPDSEI